MAEHYKALLLTDRAVKTKGRNLIYRYSDGSKRFATYSSRTVARRTAMLLMQDLRRAKSDGDYDSVIDSFRDANRSGIAKEVGLEALVPVTCPRCFQTFEVSDMILDFIANLCPYCNPPDRELAV